MLRTAVPVFAFVLFSFCGCGGEDPKARVVVYCAHDREFADDILAEFAKKSGLKVVPRYDTEANKGVQLYEDLVREANRPRCDVHWNNEIINSIRLQKRGVYESYSSPAGDDFPEQFKAKDRTWHAFAARARVLLINTKLVPKEPPTRLWDLVDKKWSKQVAMAKPQFGTTATQVAFLFQAWTPERAQAFYRQLRENGVNIVAGNKQVAVGVGQGQFAIGLTDTDDAMAEIEQKNPVAMIFHDAEAMEENLGTIFIPNTVAVIKNCPNPEGARKLVDFLLSPQVEAKLAQSASRQIPLNPKVEVQLPQAMQPALKARKLRVDWQRAAELWDEAQRFVVKEFLK